MPRAFSRTGFTLIEMLVTLAVIGLLSTLFLQAIWTAGSVTARIAGNTDIHEDVATAQRILRDRIANLRGVTRTDSATPLVDMAGERSRISFMANPIAREAPAPLQRSRILVTPERQLTLFTASSVDDRYDFEQRSLEGWRPIPLIDNVAAVEFSYFGNERLSGERRWQAGWTSQPQPPEMVRITVRFVSGDPRRWPVLIVRPRETTNVACRIDRLSGRCEGLDGIY